MPSRKQKANTKKNREHWLIGQVWLIHLSDLATVLEILTS